MNHDVMTGTHEELPDHLMTDQDDLLENLIGNSKAAMMAAIEIYNKPMFQYRDECTVILLLNAWELLLKSILLKHGESIFYAKNTDQTDKTLSWTDAFEKAKKYFPSTVQVDPTRRNLDMLSSYRNNAIHLYNEENLSVVVYSLTQTSVINFKDILLELFQIDLADQMNWRLLPIGTHPPIDAVSYIQASTRAAKPSGADKFLAELAQSVEQLVSAGEDTGRLLTVFSIKLESIKKIGEADAVVGVTSEPTQDGALAVIRRQDPNQSHPLRQTEILDQIKKLHGERFTQYTFQAIIWKHGIKGQPQYCWEAKGGNLTVYSNDVITFIKRLAKAEVEESVNDYREYLKSRSNSKANKL